MPLGLVQIQHIAHLFGEVRIESLQPVRDVLVDGRFAHAEHVGAGAHGGPGFEYMAGGLRDAQLDFPLHSASPPLVAFQAMRIFGDISRGEKA